MSEPSHDAAHAQAVSLFDARPFFEKALRYGLQHGLIDHARQSAMHDEAAKGMVQIARYFGSEYLRPELERARERMVNMVSLHLQVASNGDLRQAAELLRDNSLLSRSKAGSDMLKALIVMPQSSHFGMNERGGFSDRHVPQLARWSQASFSDYQVEFQARQRAVLAVKTALWMAANLGLDADTLHDIGADADAVIRTALLVHAAGRDEFPDWAALEKLLHNWRQKTTAAGGPVAMAKTLAPKFKLPASLPPESRDLVQSLRTSVLADLPKLLNTRMPLRTLLDQTPAFMGRYFWVEDALSEVDQLDTRRSQAWDKLTHGHSDDATLLTLLLCVSAAQTPKASLTDKAVATLVRRLRKQGWGETLVQDWLRAHAPAHYLDDCITLWHSFSEHAQNTLLSDRDTKLKEALALLRLECNITST